MGVDNTLEGHYIKRLKLSFGRIVLDDDYGHIMAKIATAARLNPNSATPWDIARRRFSCHTCLAYILARMLKTRETYPAADLMKWLCILWDAISTETQGLGKYLSVSQETAQVRSGKDHKTREVPPGTQKDIITHVKISHGIEQPVNNADFFKLEDADYHFAPPFSGSLFTKELLVVSDWGALGNGADIDRERLLVEQFDVTDEDEDEEDMFHDFEPTAEAYENFESDTEYER
ncbi:hypothetical protein NP233_g5115 [Leucocoprinus birnbaumii]|uniref:Uncharacterized protein n=1 Tax=Leucocoprinus birnbaumii TaxID=56174 RepID=A0AAD5YX06_9AGAR|nr:hypothetical protein NP233_g5115 [Leucocoprinus birnbaumii]